MDHTAVSATKALSHLCRGYKEALKDNTCGVTVNWFYGP